VPWPTDANGLSRRSKYVDRAPKPVMLNQGAFGYYARHLDLIGELAFVLTKKGEGPFFDCSSGLEFERGDTVSALGGSFGIQVGLARTWSMTRTFPAGKCQSCVAIMSLIEARLIEDGYYTRRKRLKARGTVRNLIREPGCEEHYSRDCVAKPDCPDCPQDKLMTSTLHEIATPPASDGEQRAVSLAVESFESTHETSDGLLADCYDWMNASFAAEESDTTSGVFVDVPWQRLTYLPPDLASSGRSFLPAAMISAGLDVEPLGGIVLPQDEGFPLVFLVPKTDSVRLNVAYVPPRVGRPRELPYVQSVVADLDSAPMSILSAIMAPAGGATFSGGGLQILLSDERTDRRTILRVPLATLATDYEGTANS
jgi:hypothetical protein